MCTNPRNVASSRCLSNALVHLPYDRGRRTAGLSLVAQTQCTHHSNARLFPQLARSQTPPHWKSTSQVTTAFPSRTLKPSTDIVHPFRVSHIHNFLPSSYLLSAQPKIRPAVFKNNQQSFMTAAIDTFVIPSRHLAKVGSISNLSHSSYN